MAGMSTADKGTADKGTADKGTGMVMDSEKVIGIHTCGTCIRVPGGFTVPVSRG